MKKVAIIDDEKDILEILKQLFDRSGKFQIETYTNPKNAIEKSQNGEYDLILLDIMMPQMNGIDFLKKLKATSSKTKVIMMTAYSTQDRVNECEEAGADDFVTKPFPSLRLVEEKVISLLR